MFRQSGLGGDKHGDFTDYVRRWGSFQEQSRGGGALSDTVRHHLVKKGFTVIPNAFPGWHTRIVELYHDLLEREHGDVFQVWDDTVGEVVDDKYRKILDLRSDSLLLSSIVGPATEVMQSHGFLDVYGDAALGRRCSRDSSYIRSLAYEREEDIRFQGFHTEGNPQLADQQGLQFALYTLVAGSRGAEVHLYPGHMGGDPVKYGKVEGNPILPVRVILQAGDMLVMTGGTRHRGTGYIVQNDRFFISFKAGKSWSADEGTTHELQELGDVSEEYVLGELNIWQVPAAWRGD